MKVTCFNGSPRSAGNTYSALRFLCDRLEEYGHTTQIMQVGGVSLRGCCSCGACKRHRNNKCVINDNMNSLIAEMISSDVIILGSPTYYSGLTSEMKALIDRGGYVVAANKNPLKRKIGAAVAIADRSGASMTFSQLNMFFTMNEMVVVSSNYWNVSTAKNIGDFAEDLPAQKTLTILAENINWAGERLI